MEDSGEISAFAPGPGKGGREGGGEGGRGGNHHTDMETSSR